MGPPALRGAHLQAVVLRPGRVGGAVVWVKRPGQQRCGTWTLSSISITLALCTLEGRLAWRKRPLVLAHGACLGLLR